MKFIKSFLNFINEGAYIDPENPEQAILTYANLKMNDPLYNDEMLVTQVDMREKRGEYIIDKYYALSLPNLDQTEGLSIKKIKVLDHLGRPKATMDLLKDGKIKGGQAALDEFLKKAVPSVQRGKIDYVCGLDSTGGLVKMMMEFFTSVYESTPVDLPKATFSTIVDAIRWDSLIKELTSSEINTKNKLKQDLEKYIKQNRYILNLAKSGIPFRLPYPDPDSTPSKKKKITKKFSKPDLSESNVLSEVKRKHTTILKQFFGAITDAIDIPGTPKKIFKGFIEGKLQKIEKIISLYVEGNEKNIGDIDYIPKLNPEIGKKIEKEIEELITGINFQENYKLRTSGTVIGGSMRRVFKDKYSYTASFEEALIDCLKNNKKMLIIDDNIATGTDFRNIDRQIQQILSKNGFDIFDRDRTALIENVKMFVLYDMGSNFEVKNKGKTVETLNTNKDVTSNFKNSLLKNKGKIPGKVVMSHILYKDDKVPKPSMPTIKLKINQLTGEIEDVEIDVSKTQLRYEKDYNANVNPLNWNFPFDIGHKIFSSNGEYTPEFQNWAKSIELWVNGKAFK